jgi:hypothetical protein
MLIGRRYEWCPTGMCNHPVTHRPTPAEKQEKQCSDCHAARHTGRTADSGRSGHNSTVRSLPPSLDYSPNGLPGTARRFGGFPCTLPSLLRPVTSGRELARPVAITGSRSPEAILGRIAPPDSKLRTKPFPSQRSRSPDRQEIQGRRQQFSDFPRDGQQAHARTTRTFGGAVAPAANGRPPLENDYRGHR